MNITYIFSFLVGVFVMSCSSDQTSQDSCVEESIIDEFSVCIEIYQPVCGCDGITYPNSCYATTLNGVTSYSEGSCN